MQEADSEEEAFNAPPAWRSAINAIKNIIDGGEMMELAKELPEGPGSKLGLENLAREYCAVRTSTDLALAYNILGVTTCIAAQGGFLVKAPIKDGGFLSVPAIQMFMGVAPSGFGKSTVMEIGSVPLDQALLTGLADRREMLPGLRAAAQTLFEDNNTDATLVADPKQFNEVFTAGLCPKTMTDDATPEALRNQVVANGGHGGVLAPEPELFRAIGAYSKDNGSLSLILNGWDQRRINTTRVGNSDLTIEDASFPICVLFQTEVFSEITSGNMHGMGTGADNFTDRGMFGRFKLVETTKTGDFVAIAQSYSDDEDFDHNPNDVNGYTDETGALTALGAAALDFENALVQLQLDTNAYRVSKALHRAWGMAYNKWGLDLQVPEPAVLEREVIYLDSDARLAYRRVQRMMNEIMNHVNTSEDEENKRLWNPMATRIVQHVLREAMVVALSAGRREISGELIEDAACRILPWVWCHTANALTRRANERAEDIMAEAVLSSNPAQRDLTSTAMLRDALFKLAKEYPDEFTRGIPISKLRERVKSKLGRRHRNSISTLLRKELPLLTADPTSGIIISQGPKNAAGHSVEYYQVRVPVNW